MPDIPEPPAEPPAYLQGRRRELYDALLELDPVLARMYAGARAVLEDGNNPDRLVQSSHSLRELIEFLPRALGIAEASLLDLTRKVDDLERDLDSARESEAYCDGAWEGAVDDPLRNLIVNMEALGVWRAGTRRQRREIIRETVTALTVSERVLPDPLLEAAVHELMDSRGYFTQVSHQRATTETEIRQRLEALERLLLDQLRPRAFADFDEIDNILSEAGRDN